MSGYTPETLSALDLRWSGTPASTREEAVRRYNAYPALLAERDALRASMEEIATAAETGASLIEALAAGVTKVEHPLQRMGRIARTARAALARKEG